MGLQDSKDRAMTVKVGNPSSGNSGVANVIPVSGVSPKSYVQDGYRSRVNDYLIRDLTHKLFKQYQEKEQARQEKIRLDIDDIRSAVGPGSDAVGIEKKIVQKKEEKKQKTGARPEPDVVKDKSKIRRLFSFLQYRQKSFNPGNSPNVQKGKDGLYVYKFKKNAQVKEARKSVRRDVREHRALMITLLIMLAVSTYFIGTQLTGYVVAGLTTQEYVQQLDWTVAGNNVSTWQLGEHPGVFELTSVKMSGYTMGEGRARAYLLHDGVRYLIYDSAQVIQTLGEVTGFAVNPPDVNMSLTVNDTGVLIDGNDTDEGMGDESDDTGVLIGGNDTVIPIDGNDTDEGMGDESNVTGVLIDGDDSVMPIGVNDTNESMGDENNVTGVLIDGDDSVMSIGVNDTDESMGDESDDTDNARVIMLNLSYRSGSKWDVNDDGIADLNDGVVDLTVEGTQFNWVVDESKLCTYWTVQSREGSTNVCNGAADCCALFDLAPQEIEWDEPLFIYHGRYGAGDYNTVYAKVVFVNQSLGDVGDVYYDSVQSHQDGLLVGFQDLPDPFIDACIDSCTLPHLTDDDYQIEFVLDSGAVLHVSNITYVLKDLSEDVSIDVAITDSDEYVVPAYVEFIDDRDNVKASRNVTLPEVKRGKKRPDGYGVSAVDSSVDINTGVYDVKVSVSDEGNPIESIELYDLMVDAGSGFIKIDDVDESGDFAQYDEVYALDPTEMEFANATINVREAVGTSLYKCADWDFENQDCRETCIEDDGEEICEERWMLVKELVPGEPYDFVMDRTDPAYAEYTETTGQAGTSSTKYISLLQQNFTVETEGDFLLLGTMQAHGVSTASDVMARLVLDGNVLGDAVWKPHEPSNIKDYQTFASHSVEHLPVGTYSSGLEYASGNEWAPVYARDARLSTVSLEDAYHKEAPAVQDLNTGWSAVSDLEFNLDEADDYLILVSGQYSPGSTEASAYLRMLVDGQEVDASDQEAKDTEDSIPFMYHEVSSLGIGPHTISLEGMRETGADAKVRGVRLSAVRLTEDRDMHHQGSTGESTTTSDDWVTKTDMDMVLGENSSYMFIATAQVGGTGVTQARFVVDGMEICRMAYTSQELSTPPDYATFACTPAYDLGEGEHDAQLMYKAIDGTARIKYARITAFKVDELHSVQVEVNLSVKDAKGNTIDSEVEIFDKSKKKLYDEKGKRHAQTLAKGRYDVKIKLQNKSVKQIMFNDMELSDNKTAIVDVDEPEDKQGWKELYAVNPEMSNFTNATVTVTASADATQLYKCKDWDFDAQECPESREVNCRQDPDESDSQICDMYGGWSYVMDINPGEEYNFTLTPADPGFAEGSPSTGTPDGYYDNAPGEEGSYVNTQTKDCAGGACTFSNTQVFGFDNMDGWKEWNITYEFDVSSLGITGSQISELTVDWSGCWNGGTNYCDGYDNPEWDNSNGGFFEMYILKGADPEPMTCVNTVGSECGTGVYYGGNNQSISLGTNLASPSWGDADAYHDFEFQTTGLTEGYIDANDTIKISFRTRGDSQGSNYDVWNMIDFVQLTITYTNQSTNATIKISLNDPLIETNFIQNEFNKFTVNVSCTGPDCGPVNVALDPQQSGTYQISANNRDAWDDGSSGSLNSNYFGDSNWWDSSGYQFSLPIPQNATISSAYLSVYTQANSGSDGAYTARIRVEDTASPVTFTGAVNNIRGRTYWGTTADWSIPSGGLSAGSWHNSTDISSLVQYIVNKSTWDSGDYINLAVWGQTSNGGSHENTIDYNNNPSQAPKLYVTWTEASGSSKGIIPTGSGTPFYTNKSSNPYTIDLTGGGSQLVTFWVNATGDTNSTYEFFAYANLTNDTRISNITDRINITILEYLNNPPTHSTPLLTSSGGTNTTVENLTCYNQSTNDADGDSVKNVYDWLLNGTTIMLTNAPFEGGSTGNLTRDYSGALGYNLTASAMWNATGGHDRLGAYEFDGSSQYIDLDSGGSSSVYDSAFTERTVALWYNADSVTGTSYRVLYGEGGGTNGMSIYIYDSDIWGGAWSEGSGWNGNWSSFSTTADEWHFVAVVFDGAGTSISLYHDGSWTSISDPGATQVNAHSGDDAIGRADGKLKGPSGNIGSGSYFSGTIDEFMAFDRALSKEQLDALYYNMTNTLVSQETDMEDRWQVCVTPNDGEVDGEKKCSNILAIADGDPPGSVTGLSESATGKDWIAWSWINPTDEDFNKTILYLNGTNVANTTANSYNFTGLQGITKYHLDVNTVDHFGNINDTDVSDNAMTLDSLAPQYSSITDENNTAYTPGGSYQFNSTWTDNVAVSAVTFEMDGTNYTNPIQVGDLYYVTMIGLAGGFHDYAWHAVDFLSNYNNTGPITFNVGKASANVTLTSTGGWNKTYGLSISVECSTDTPGVDLSLYRDGVVVSNPDTTGLAAGNYSYLCNSTETQNYSAGNATEVLVINKAASQVNLLMNGNDSNLTLEREGEANITGIILLGDEMPVYVYKNGTLSGSGPNPYYDIQDYEEDTDYNITLVYNESQNYTSSSETHWLLVRDTTPPGPVAMLGEQSVGADWIFWKWVEPSDADYAEAILYLNGTNVANTTANSYNFTGLDAYTVYRLTVKSKDASGVVGDENVSDSALTLDITPPAYSSVIDENLTRYQPLRSYQFNITWTDAVGVQNVIFEFEGVNYSGTSNMGDEYYISMSNLAVGSHDYRWHASDSTGNKNMSDWYTFVLDKQITTMNLSSITGWNNTYGDETTVSCVADNDEVIEELWRDGVQVSNPDVQTLGGGNHSYVCNASSSSNYTANNSQNILTINRAVPIVYLYLNGTDGNRTFEVHSLVNQTGLHDQPCNLSMYKNGTLVQWGSSPLERLSVFDTLGVFNITLQHPLTQNHTSSVDSHIVTIQDTTAPVVTQISPADDHAQASQSRLFEFNVTDNYYPTLDCYLYVNDTLTAENLSAPVNTTVTFWKDSLPEGYNMWYVSCTDGSGNKGVSQLWNLTVDVTPPVVVPVRPAVNETIGYILYFSGLISDNLVGVDTVYVVSRNSSGVPVFGGVIPPPYALLINTSVYFDGWYNLTAIVNDTVGNTMQIDVPHWINNTQPFIQFIVPETGTHYNSNFNMLVQVQDNLMHTIIHNLTAENGTLITQNQHEVINQTFHTEDELVNVSGLSCGNYTINVWVNDTDGYVVQSSSVFVIDRKPPEVTNITEPSDPATYAPGQTLEFNSTWSDNEYVEQVLIEWNGTNHTTTNSGDVYSVQMQNLSAGTYRYTWFGADYAGNWNNSDSYNFTILPAIASCVLAFDKSSPQTFGTPLLANCSSSNPDTAPKLWRDGLDVTATEGNQYVTLSGGDHAYVCNATETLNYSSCVDNVTFTIDTAATALNLSILPSWNETYGTETIVTCAADNDEVVEQLWRNGQSVAIPHTATLAAGSHNYTCNASASTNYSAQSSSSLLTINKAASSVSLKINGTSSNRTIERKSAANLTAERLVGSGPVQLVLDDEEEGSGQTYTSLTTYNSEAVINVTAYYPETENHTSSQVTYFLTVNDTIQPGAITNLVLMTTNQNYLYWVWTNPDDTDYDHNEVYINGTLRATTANEYFYATGLNHSTVYELEIRTVDTSGTYGPWVNDTQRTSYNCTEDWKAQYGACRFNDTRIKYYTDAASCGIYFNLPGDNGTTSACDCVVSTEFDGNTTNFTRNNLTGLQDVVLANDGVGEIRFTQSIDVNTCVDLDDSVAITSSYVEIDSESLPELNKSAQVTIYNLTYDDPAVVYNGTVCPSDICREVNYSNGTFIFNVSHWTRYEVQDGWCGDDECNGDETCTSCSDDCGGCASGVSGGGGGGGGGGSNIERPCVPNWLCYEWTPCVKNHQTRQCFDSNGCNNVTEMPKTKQICVADCAERWVCSDWNECNELGLQTRECNDLSKCGTEVERPRTVKSCLYEFCNDGRISGDETGVDCGGSCAPCLTDTSEDDLGNRMTGHSIEIYSYDPPNPVFLLPLLLLLGLITGLVFKRRQLMRRLGKHFKTIYYGIIAGVSVLLLLSLNSMGVISAVMSDISKMSAVGVFFFVIIPTSLGTWFIYKKAKAYHKRLFADEANHLKIGDGSYLDVTTLDLKEEKKGKVDVFANVFRSLKLPALVLGVLITIGLLTSPSITGKAAVAVGSSRAAIVIIISVLVVGLLSLLGFLLKRKDRSQVIDLNETETRLMLGGDENKDVDGQDDVGRRDGRREGEDGQVPDSIVRPGTRRDEIDAFIEELKSEVNGKIPKNKNR